MSRVEDAPPCTTLPFSRFMRDPSIAAALGYTGLVTTSLAVWLETIALEQVPAAEMRWARASLFADVDLSFFVIVNYSSCEPPMYNLYTSKCLCNR